MHVGTLTDKELASFWIEAQHLPETSPEFRSLEWVIIKVQDIQFYEPEKCWAVILEVIKLTDDEQVLANLAAGPVETLLAEFPKKVILWVEEEATKNPKLRKILSGVWKNAIPDEEWKRLQALIE